VSVSFYLRAIAVVIVCLVAGRVHSEAPASELTPDSLIGAWKLLKIEYSGPSGPMPDPTFWANSQGLIVYDRSGWMSVQIFAPNRPTIANTVRTSGVFGDDSSARAAAFDTYYAYFGTWEFNAATCIVTHHLKSSLLPYETGSDYKRNVTFDGKYLKLTVHQQQNEQPRERVLTWERVVSR
jgi:hypothetical protein